MKCYNGVVIGISAGSMNCSSTVYAIPEEPNDLSDPDYQLFLPGLALTDVMIIPHMNRLRYQDLCGLRYIDDIAVRDSVGHTFYAIPDGSYVYFETGHRPEIRGEAYRIKDQLIDQVCTQDQVFPL